MKNIEDTERTALAEKVSDPDYDLPAAATIVTGTPESRAEALAMLLDAAETPEARTMVRRVAVGGRPALDPAGSASVPWRLRVPSTLDKQFRTLVEAEGRKFSEVLRSAAEEYVAAHGRERSQTGSPRP